jgi:hypothetical protein
MQTDKEVTGKHAEISEILKVNMDWAEWTCNVKLFQARGPATQKALSPSNVRVLGTSTDSASADRRPDLRPIDEVGRTRSMRYDGALPCRQRKTIVQSLYSTLSAIGSKWQSRSNGVTWSYLRAPATSRTDAFKIVWSHRKSHEGSPVKTTLQKSRREWTRLVTSASIAIDDGDRRIERIWRNAQKHEAATCEMWDLSDISPST